MKKCKKFNNISIFKNTYKGLGSAISLGVKKSLKKYIVIFMSDLSDDINDMKKYHDIISKKLMQYLDLDLYQVAKFITILY